MGAPPAAEATPADGLLGGPPPSAASAPVPVTTTNPNLRTWRRPDGTLVTAMAPIANPKSSSIVRSASAPSLGRARPPGSMSRPLRSLIPSPSR
jgi:hypothetical protein